MNRKKPGHYKQNNRNAIYMRQKNILGIRRGKHMLQQKKRRHKHKKNRGWHRNHSKNQKPLQTRRRKEGIAQRTKNSQMKQIKNLEKTRRGRKQRINTAC